MELTTQSENKQSVVGTLLSKVDVASRPVQPPIVACACAILAADSHLRCHAGVLSVNYMDESLVITGRLPSYFLKQIVQERLRVLQVPIVNKTSVLPR